MEPIRISALDSISEGDSDTGKNEEVRENVGIPKGGVEEQPFQINESKE